MIRSIFAVTPDFIHHYTSGMRNSLVILSGCSGLYSTDLTQPFLSKGTSVYLGWDGSVGLEYVDTIAMPSFVTTRVENPSCLTELLERARLIVCD